MNLVSIVINCHNGEKYLEDSVRSLINQTYKNIEVIDIIYNHVLSNTLKCVLTAATASNMIFDIAFMLFKTTLQKNMIDAGEKTYNISDSKTHAELYTKFRNAAVVFTN